MTDEPNRERQAEHLRYLLQTGAFRFIDARTPWFPYTSGQVGPYYVQSTAIEKNGAYYAAAIEALADVVRSLAEPFEVISGGESRDWDFSNPVAVRLKTPHLKLYKDGRALGAEIAGRAVLHVADLNNEGASVRDLWRPMIERGGGRLVGAVFYVDRLEDGFAVLTGMGLRPRSVVPLDARAWRLAREAGYVSDSVHAALVERLADRGAWAERALLAHPEHFRALHADPASRGRAESIMRAYPRIRAALERLVASS